VLVEALQDECSDRLRHLVSLSEGGWPGDSRAAAGENGPASSR
jgi:hypothetical protein